MTPLIICEPDLDGSLLLKADQVHKHLKMDSAPKKDGFVSLASLYPACTFRFPGYDECWVVDLKNNEEMVIALYVPGPCPSAQIWRSMGVRVPISSKAAAEMQVVPSGP